MASDRLTRVDALERQTGSYVPGVWIEGLPGEGLHQAMARHEGENGALDPGALHIIWLDLEVTSCVN